MRIWAQLVFDFDTWIDALCTGRLAAIRRGFGQGFSATVGDGLLGRGVTMPAQIGKPRGVQRQTPPDLWGECMGARRPPSPARQN